MKMYSYIVAYDLCKPDRDYQSLYEMLRSFPNWGKMTESVWCIVSRKRLRIYTIVVFSFIRTFAPSF